MLIDHVADLVEELAKAGGPSMMPLVNACIPLFLKFCEPSRPPSDVSMAIGSFGELTQILGSCFLSSLLFSFFLRCFGIGFLEDGLFFFNLVVSCVDLCPPFLCALLTAVMRVGQAMAPFVHTVMPIALKGVASSNMLIRRNSCFTVGTLCLNCPQQSLPFFSDALSALQTAYAPLSVDEDRKRGITDQQEFLAARDNACSAMAKMVLSLASQGPPPPRLVELVLEGLPLTGDPLENKFVYQCLLTLFAKHPQVVSVSSFLLCV